MNDFFSYRFDDGNRVLGTATTGDRLIICYASDGASYGQHRLFVDGIERAQTGSGSASKIPNVIDNAFSLVEFIGNYTPGQQPNSGCHDLVIGPAVSQAQVNAVAVAMATKYNYSNYSLITNL